ncbi:MAG: hydantoinase B/oxoprolinase family protein, partial [Candidatus Puniceispirillaceae bacterium]
LLEESATAFLFGERGKFAPPGVAGGGAGAANRFYFDSDGPDAVDGRESPPLVSKMTGIKLKRGQRVRLETPGGGGYGDAGSRTREQHQQDLDQGYVTADGKGGAS